MQSLDLTLAAFCSLWVIQAAVTIKNVSEMRTLAELEPVHPDSWPKVSSIVPAKDEEAKLSASVKTRLADEYPHAEFVFVDDRSSDGTSELLSQAAARDERILVERVDELPAGWLGKVHALSRGVRRANGEWLLISDADITFERGTLQRAVAVCEADGLDFLALVPEFKSRSWAVDLLWAVFIRVFTMAVSPFAVRDPSRRTAAGSGSFMLLRRSAFLETDGFEWLRMETGDDMALGMLMKRSGARCELMNGRGSIRVAIYDSLRDFYTGVEKNAGTLSALPLGIMAALLLVALVVEFAPLTALAWATAGGGASWLLGAGVAALVLQVTATAVPLRANNGMVWPALLAPLGWLLMASGLFRSALLGKSRGGVMWRGTFYSNHELREGQRYHLW